MCVAIPMQVIRASETMAWCLDRDGTEVAIDTLMTGPAAPGQWLLTFLGGAREVVSAEDAKRISDALDGLQSALAGDLAGVDAAFADLIGREPQLPDFLRQDFDKETR